MTSLFTGWLLALMLGARHASEPDHVAAVSTMVAGAQNARRAAWLGAVWGVGHSLALLLVGVCLMWLQLGMSERTAALFELAVACMLLVLGVRSVTRAVLLLRAAPARAPGERAMSHVHVHVVHAHEHGLHAARRPLVIGLVHGLAGSGALSALAIANMPSFATAVVYIVCFGAGSVLGMMALSGIAGLPLARLGQSAHVQASLFAGAGLVSLVLGVLWGWPLLDQIQAG
ncbi:MAG: hypothetical protein ABW321_22960 [Polyangiales bacterium]